MSIIRSRIIACGSYLPEKVMTNEELSTFVDTSDEWISQRSGIRERRIAARGEKTSDMAIAAARDAMARAGLGPDDIDGIVLATTTPDKTFPATAATVQNALGMSERCIPAFDVQAVCSGFVYALTVADNFIKAGQGKRWLVIGAEHFTSLLDWKDRTTCVLFGDGAGAVILEATEQPGDRKTDSGILVTRLHCDGRYTDLLYVDGGPSSTGTTGHVRMNGKEVFRHAVNRLSQVGAETLEEGGFTGDDIDWVVPHQANKRIIDSTAKKLKIPAERLVLTVDKHGNTSAASIPLALAEAVNGGRIKEGDLLLLEAMGGGLTWGAALVRW